MTDVLSLRKRPTGLSTVVESARIRDWLAGQLSPDTRRAYASDLRAFQMWAAARGVIPHIARREGESRERLGRHRWVVERTLFWRSTCRALVVRYDQHAANVRGCSRSLGRLLAWALLWFRRL
jgi:hypothetical protein